MIRKSTLVMGIVLLLVAGIGTYIALAAFAPKQATETAVDTSPRSDNDTITSFDDDSGQSLPSGGTSTDNEGLSMTRRDVAVKTIMSRIAAGMTSYSSNNRGATIQTESQLASFTTSYLADADMTDSATGTQYQISLDGPGEGIIYYQPGHKCSDDGMTTVPGSSRQIVLTTTLPSGTVYCLEP